MDAAQGYEVGEDTMQRGRSVFDVSELRKGKDGQSDKPPSKKMKPSDEAARDVQNGISA